MLASAQNQSQQHQAKNNLKTKTQVRQIKQISCKGKKEAHDFLCHGL